MKNLGKIRAIANNARVFDKYELAAKNYKILYDNGMANDWEKYYYAFCLFKLNKIDAALKIVRNFYKNKKDFKPINSLYARLIMKKIFSNEYSADFQTIVKGINGIRTLIPEDDNFLDFNKFVFNLLKKLFENKKYQTIINICNSFYPFENKDFEKKKMSETEFPCLAQSCFIFMAKSYFSLGNHTKTIEIIDKAFEKIKRFNFDFDIWLKRIKALAFEGLENYTEAIKLYFYLLKRKKDWFLRFELAKILRKTEFKKASDYFLIKALEDKQNPKYKIKLYEYLNQIDQNLLAPELLKKILCVLKKENKSKCETIFEEKQVLSELKAETDKILKSIRAKGKILKIFNNKNGILICGKEKFFYFCNKCELSEGDSVFFEKAWNFDFKKKKVRASAIILEK